MLEIKDIYKTFNAGTINEKRALNGVNLNLNPGDFVTIIGGNGAGKSTTLNAIAGVWGIDKGNIIIDGTDITKLSEHKRALFLGRVFQDPMTGTAATMSIEENMAIAARRGQKRGLGWGVTKKEREHYREALKELDLGLEDRLSSKVGLLSGGQRQAITLLMASLKKPKLLLLDEHTAALDPKTAAKVLALSDKIISENNLTAMMVTHNMKDAIRLGNRLIMMHEGRIIYDVAGEEKKNLQVSDLLAKRHQQLDKLDELVKSRFIEMFGNDQEFNRWSCCKIANVADITVGVVIKPAQYYTNCGIPAFRSRTPHLDFSKQYRNIHPRP